MLSFDKIFSQRARSFLKAALEEDIGSGDITSELLIPKKAHGKAVIIAKQSGIFCGGPVIEELFHIMDPKLRVTFLVDEGNPVKKNRTMVRIHGNIRSILEVERTALNFLGRLSAIATKTKQFIGKVRKDSVLILDTRKTTPLLREFEKYAVRVGGGKNHRMGLYDAILVKENHRPHGDLSKLEKFKNRFEVEVRNMKEFHEVLKLSPQIILFDNFRPSSLRQAVQLARAKKPEVILEASGGITLENVSHYAAMGIDWISIGALTHTIKSLDFSLLVS
ncbi:MAG: carboxylating nicotinate-nucleotide diphosphorylase [Candidatus Omnitrophica bacterium]|nr:carboxylating nicotinate-nucleotide diphosphorylase [Candidatus Omnitrophota bacterium]MDD5670372.1 carboxylating nicotinate-nucleotide diphosphorylase [Candidatus Omnitrophota bacterium]